MNWVGKSNPALVEAIVASFSCAPKRAFQDLAQFKPEDWLRTESWLDTSGLALYFLDHVCSRGISAAVDNGLLHRLEQKRADNRHRNADMLQEFVSINQMFHAAGIHYANLKGFTLSPDSCPDLSLRHQSDFDFLIDPAHLNIGRTALEKRGYALTGSTPYTLEFKSGSAQKISLEGRYKALPTRSVELHTTMESTQHDLAPTRDKRLDRLSEWTCNQGTFPALSSADQLIGQALHILSHLRGEHTRPSWLLEYRHHVMVRQGDAPFWKEVLTLASAQPEATIALGLSTLLAADIFGDFTSPELNAWTLDTLPLAVKLWAATYGRRAVLANVPGTKLYLLLDSVLAQARPSYRPRLLPRLLPQRILRPPPQDNLRLRLHRDIVQLQYILYRLHFHVEQGALHMIESRRWNKLLEQASRTTERRSQT
jgi:hypothetical protein